VIVEYLRVGVKWSALGAMPVPTRSEEILSVDELVSLLVFKSIANVARAGVVRCCWDISINDMALKITRHRSVIYLHDNVNAYNEQTNKIT